jgi:arginase
MPLHTPTFIGAALGHGARDRRTEHGPQYLFSWGLMEQLAARGIEVAGGDIVHPAYRAPRATPLEIVAEVCAHLSQGVAQALRNGRFPVVLGGDHSCAVGTWSGVSVARGRKPIGLIWIDAHCDSHTPETSESGALHGMPLAALFGHGDARLTKIAHPGRKIDPAHAVLIGIRSFESGEMQLLERLGVRVYLMAEVLRRGFAAVFEEALAHVRAVADHFGVTFDLDALDPADAPGVGSPEAGGIGAVELVEAFARLHDDPQLVACEITEYNPFLDVENRTAAVVREALANLLTPRAMAVRRPELSQTAHP